MKKANPLFLFDQLIDWKHLNGSNRLQICLCFIFRNKILQYFIKSISVELKIFIDQIFRILFSEFLQHIFSGTFWLGIFAQGKFRSWKLTMDCVLSRVDPKYRWPHTLNRLALRCLCYFVFLYGHSASSSQIVDVKFDTVKAKICIFGILGTEILQIIFACNCNNINDRKFTFISIS